MKDGALESLFNDGCRCPFCLSHMNAEEEQGRTSITSVEEEVDRGTA